jgi:hypothetical protein
MLHSERDLARKVAKALTSSGTPEFQEATTRVEEVLAKGRAETPAHFDAITSVAVANLIVAIAKLAFDIWKHHADAQNKAVEGMLRARAEEIKDWREADSRVKEDILGGTLEVIRNASS